MTPWGEVEDNDKPLFTQRWCRPLLRGRGAFLKACLPEGEWQAPWGAGLSAPWGVYYYGSEFQVPRRLRRCKIIYSLTNLITHPPSSPSHHSSYLHAVIIAAVITKPSTPFQRRGLLYPRLIG